MFLLIYKILWNVILIILYIDLWLFLVYSFLLFFVYWYKINYSSFVMRLNIRGIYMLVGVLKEIKNYEYCVGLMFVVVKEFVSNGY